MSEADPVRPYHELVALVDGILDACEDDVPCIVNRLAELDDGTLAELFTSDLLNAYQVFYFMFRADPGDLARERLELSSASFLREGLLLDETDLLEMYFGIRDGTALIAISDGDKVVAAFSGTGAYAAGCEFLRNPEWQ